MNLPHLSITATLTSAKITLRYITGAMHVITVTVLHAVTVTLCYFIINFCVEHFFRSECSTWNVFIKFQHYPINFGIMLNVVF